MKIFLFAIFTSAIFYAGCVQPTSTEAGSGENSKPVINNITVEPQSVKIGATATVTITASDPDGDQLSYTWTVPLGDIIGSGHKVRYTAAFCCVGINTINVNVIDSRGASVTGKVNVEVIP